MAVSKKFIDLEKVISEKNPSLAKWLPGPILGWLKRLVHEDDCNRFIEKNGHLRDHEFVEAVLNEVGAKIEVRGLEYIPLTGGVIVAANHPLGGLDGVGLMKAVASRRLDIRFIVNDILLAMTGFGNLFVGVNKHGANSRDGLRLMDETFASENCTLFFPAGLVSRRQNGIIRDLDWHKSFISKAVQHRRPVVPCFISGRNSEFFYNLASWRKKLGVKANIEMAWLVDEIYKQRGQTIRFQFGPPISPEQFTREKTHAEWAAWLKNEVYLLNSEY